MSRSHIRWYKHNDVNDLEQQLSTIVNENKHKKLNRRFIVCEGISAYYGDICPLDKIVDLAKKYKFRLILDDSLGVGVLGKQGRGTIEHYNISLNDIELLCGTLDAAIGSVGGFCVSSSEFVIDHQRITSAGYVFSATSPPYTAAAASQAFEIIQHKPELLEQLRQKSIYIRTLLRSIDNVVIHGSDISPLIYIRLATSYGIEQDVNIIDDVILLLLDYGIAATAPDYVPFERRTPSPAVRLVVCNHHTQDDINKTAEACKKAFKQILDKYNKT